MFPEITSRLKGMLDGFNSKPVSWVASPTQVTFGVCGSATYGMAASMASFDLA